MMMVKMMVMMKIMKMTYSQTDTVVSNNIIHEMFSGTFD